VVFRSLVVPVKAILMNLLSVGATYGLVVLVFLKGFGAGILGFQEIDKFEAWVPIFLFCMLFGLSMDYHVFLLSRIKERFDQTGNNTESVAFGLRSTGGIITGAALIMVTIFWAFSAGDLVMFQQMGFGMAVAVFLDATIVRCVLVPSAMRLLGMWNWYLPRALKWLPEVRLKALDQWSRSWLLLSSLAYSATEPATSLVTTIRDTAPVVRGEGECLNNTNPPAPYCFSIEGSNGGLAFRLRWHFNKSMCPGLATANILVAHDGYK
jgi:uncharacterized membrane protein YdfJ with MMPL/SSD domain